MQDPTDDPDDAWIGRLGPADRAAYVRDMFSAEPMDKPRIRAYWQGILADLDKQEAQPISDETDWASDDD